jgi:hypothetical protein
MKPFSAFISFLLWLMAMNWTALSAIKKQSFKTK